MRVNEFLDAYDVLPEAMLLLGGDGVVLAANRAAAELLQRKQPEIAGTSLLRYALEDEVKLNHFLSLCRRNRQFLLGAITMRRADGSALPCRCEGALVRPAPDAAAQVLLRALPKEASASRFLALNQRIDALNREVLVRKRAQADLRQLNVSLEHLNGSLRQFAYAAAHDLKEPLRAIGIYSEVLATRYKGRIDGHADQFLGIIQNSADRMHSMVDGLLAFTQAGEIIDSEPGVVNLEKVLEAAIGNIAVAAAETQAVITHDKLPAVKAHELPLVQLFQNLIANSIKYRKPGETPSIHISAEATQLEWLFSVRDNGVGIAPEYHQYVFGIFKRLSRNESGTGIGLAICQRVVEGYGGRIWIESEEGKGATFFFTLPNEAVAQAAS